MLPNVILRWNQSALCSLVSRQVKSLSSINSIHTFLGQGNTLKMESRPGVCRADLWKRADRRRSLLIHRMFLKERISKVNLYEKERK